MRRQWQETNIVKKKKPSCPCYCQWPASWEISDSGSSKPYLFLFEFHFLSSGKGTKSLLWKLYNRAYSSPHLSHAQCSAVLPHQQNRRPTPIQVNSDGPRACSGRAGRRRNQKGSVHTTQIEHTHSRDPAPRQNRRATRQHTPGHTPHRHTWEHTPATLDQFPRVHGRRPSHRSGPQPLPARNWPAVGWARHLVPPRCVIRRDAAAGWGLKCCSCRAIAPAELREVSGQGGAGCGRLLGPGAPGQVRGRPLAGPSAAPASCPAVCSSRRSPSLGSPVSELWARLVPAWDRAHLLPGTPGCGRASPGGSEVPV